jgi:preprotein translocase subunit YajC
MLISEAFAQAQGAAPQGGIADILSGPLGSLAPVIFVIAIMYFLFLRPQQRKAMLHREMVANLRRGDTVVTAGGLIGKVAKVDESEVQVELAEGVRVKVVRGTISEVRAKGEPVKDGAES